jgi:hypothetical protein
MQGAFCAAHLRPVAIVIVERRSRREPPAHTSAGAILQRTSAGAMPARRANFGYVSLVLPPLAMSDPGDREVYFEFVKLGNAVKVTAIDSLTAIEVSVMGPANAAQSDLERVALQKLRMRLRRE